jgi:tetratricopeptide (TPR) repeat protein
LVGWKLWLFRLIALVGAPLFFFGLLELVLRVAGTGYPTSFLLTASLRDQKMFVQNNQFGWRFFGRDLARWPYPLSIPQSKPTNTVRILVLGESAARGEPQPDFGLPRVLEAMLSLRYPGTRFEVINAAMVAINSHAILPIARDCVRAGADIWVIYMGNNEVVGPFGAGTIFGSQSQPLPLIRASLTAKATRTGQLLDSMLQGAQSSRNADTVWGGMTMFLDQQIRADDPRMVGVYHNFECNLTDILQAGKRSDAGIVLSTVAVNLKDCPPFASAHRPGMSKADKSKWEQLYHQGSAAQEAGRIDEAEAQFREAAALDDTFAELRFRQGECALARTNVVQARTHYQAARDLDTLRFRCDNRLNELIRRAATNSTGPRLMLADSERAFAERSADGLPGKEFFCEHVHLTFAGNYLLALTIAEQVKKLLPAWVIQRESGPDWASPDSCARRLGRSAWQEVAALNSIHATLNDPPFTGQLHHPDQMRRLEQELARRSSSVVTRAGLAAALETAESALKGAPDDAALYEQVANLKRASGDFAGAAAAAKRELELLPSDSEGWALLGSILARQGQVDEAATAFRRAFHFGPQGIKSNLQLADSLAMLGKQDEAIREYRRILAHKPGYVPALLQLGQVLEKLGRQAEADECFRLALSNRSLRLPELMDMAEFFQRRGKSEAAATVYLDALKMNSADARAQLGAARNLASLGRYDEAVTHSAEALRLAPESVEAHLMHGVVLWKMGHGTDAQAQFHEALRLQPESLDARINLGMVFAQQGHAVESLRLFEQVLERDPSNSVALAYTRSLRTNKAAPQNPSARK